MDMEPALKIFVRLAVGAIVLLLTLAFMAGYAMAYPEQGVRLGYGGCNSCHVSPTGGGVLTNYGRSLSGEMATWAPWDESKILVDQVAVGGNSRYALLKTPSGTRKFVMQQDLELALRLAPTVWVDASYGQYGAVRERQARRNFVLWTPTENVSLRAGRFFPAYGIMTPDHTTATRQGVGFGEGDETYNLEVSAHSALGEIVVTDTFGGDENVAMTKRDGYLVRAQQPGFAARATAYVASKAYAGASYWYHSDALNDTLVAGPFIAYAPTRSLYLLAEADRRKVMSTSTREATPPVDVAWLLAGWEAYRGVHLRTTAEYDKSPRYGAAIQLLPTTHTEFIAQAKYQDRAWTSLLMAHWSW